MKPFTQRELASEYKRRLMRQRFNKLQSMDIVKNKDGKYAEYKHTFTEVNDLSNDIVVRIVMALVAIVSAVTIVMAFLGK